jgi:uncharacterized iron-regulated membrane protein
MPRDASAHASSAVAAILSQNRRDPLASIGGRFGKPILAPVDFEVAGISRRGSASAWWQRRPTWRRPSTGRPRRLRLEEVAEAALAAIQAGHELRKECDVISSKRRILHRCAADDAFSV